MGVCLPSTRGIGSGLVINVRFNEKIGDPVRVQNLTQAKQCKTWNAINANLWNNSKNSRHYRTHPPPSFFSIRSGKAKNFVIEFLISNAKENSIAQSNRFHLITCGWERHVQCVIDKGAKTFRLPVENNENQINKETFMFPMFALMSLLWKGKNIR